MVLSPWHHYSLSLLAQPLLIHPMSLLSSTASILLENLLLKIPAKVSPSSSSKSMSYMVLHHGILPLAVLSIIWRFLHGLVALTVGSVVLARDRLPDQTTRVSDAP